MQIVTRLVGGGRQSLEDFADRHGFVMEVTERPKSHGHSRYLARFKDIEVGENGMLRGAYGNGDTPNEAIAAYALAIEGHRLVYRAFHPDRREVQAPNDLGADAIRASLSRQEPQ